MTLTTRFPEGTVAVWTLKRQKNDIGTVRDRIIATVKVHQRTKRPVYIPGDVTEHVRPHTVRPN